MLARWIPPHEWSRSVSCTTSGMYLGAALGMLVLPILVEFWGARSVFHVESALGAMWSPLWFKFATDPPRTEHPKATAAGFGETSLPIGGHSIKSAQIPWKRIVLSLPVWAIVVNNFTFHYALYVLMNWLPTYFEQGLHLSLQKMGFSKMIPYFIMFLLSNTGGFIADHLITSTIFISESWVCNNHMDIAPRYAGIVMGVSNTAGTLAGVIGVDLTGKLLEAAETAHLGLSNSKSWRPVLFIPGLLCIFSSVCIFNILNWEEDF
ncbi:putative anion transporter 5 [Camellia lanceoleosa]|uniref:Anion transporter 5 n=1 Tax=Camellia lanceoleosa TaxID=1840588 RepID=A0ACC0F2G3_9ERIC|nr:putative anion transporter 5 [Camellia lanceoleosa]